MHSITPSKACLQQQHLSVEMHTQEIQVSLIDLRQLQAKDTEIQALKLEMEERGRRNDELDKQMQSLS